MLEIKVTLELSKNFEKVLSGFLVLGMQNAETGKKKTCVCAAGEESEEAAEAEKGEVIQMTAQSPVVQAVQVTVPTTAKTYTLDELSRAAMTLMDMGKQEQLLGVLGEFGVPAMPSLSKDQYPAFANKLRELGADI